MTPSPSRDAAQPGAADPVAAPADDRYGLFAAARFELATGASAAGAALPQALWYFRDEVVAVPRPGAPVAAFARGVDAFDDLRRWAAVWSEAMPADLPPLVWVAAPDLHAHGRLAADGTALTLGARTLPVRCVPKIPLNRAFADATSLAHFATRPLRLRGTEQAGGFTIRSVWPADYRLGADLAARPLDPHGDPGAALRALMREAPRGGAASPFAACTLWARTATAAPAGAPVLAFVVNGAQGADDEAHAGHFAIATGRIAADGGIGDWLVNDFYTLDSESEKGIVAAPVPLDNYLGDLNAGQAWYRPSVLVAAVLRDPAAANLVQSALGRIYNHFYRHQLVYYHPDVNCTSISVDTLRTLGLAIPSRPAAHPVAAALGFPLLVARERSLARARQQCDYFSADPTRLLPAAALEEILAALGALVEPRRRAATADGTLARLLARDLDALLFLRVPQFPSSRVWGDAPVATLAEYFARLPRPPAQPVIVPVPARPFPDALRDPDLLPPPWRRSDVVAGVWGIVLLVGIPSLLATLWRRLRRRRAL